MIIQSTRPGNIQTAAVLPPPGDAAQALELVRDRTSLFFANAAERFDSASQSDSREFLAKTRQTGGE